mgnify:CR=1 FL=1
MLCPQCHEIIPNEARFCPRCGADLSSGSPVPAPGSVPNSSGGSLPQENTPDASQPQVNTPDATATQTEDSLKTLGTETSRNMKIMGYLIMACLIMHGIYLLVPVPMIRNMLSSPVGILELAVLIWSFFVLGSARTLLTDQDQTGSGNYALLCSRIKTSFIILAVSGVLLRLLQGIYVFVLSMTIVVKEKIPMPLDPANLPPELLRPVSMSIPPDALLLIPMAYPLVKFYYVKSLVDQISRGSLPDDKPRDHTMAIALTATGGILLACASALLTMLVMGDPGSAS